MGFRLHPFDQLMQLDGADIKLDCAALHLAKDTHPHLDLTKYIRQLDRLAEEVAAQKPGLDAVNRYEAMQHVIAANHGFTGQHNNLFDPTNSYLNCVLERKTGLPISLSVVWIEIARRLKWPVAGVSFPGHFLVRFDDEERYILVDPFHAGRSLDLNDCCRLAEECLGKDVRVQPNWLEPISNRDVLIRLLNNLRQAYLRRNDLPNLRNVLKRLAAAEPENGSHLCELAALHCRLGDVRRAYAHLAAYLERLPEGDDADMVQFNLQRLEAALSALN